MNLRLSSLGICLLLCSDGAAAAHAPPTIALITTDNNGGWLLFTDRAGVAGTDKIHVLGTDPKPHVTCCARVTGIATVPAGMRHFFSDALHENPPAAQHVFHVAVPADAMSPDNPTAMAAWGVANVTATANGYVLHTTSAEHYEADACFDRKASTSSCAAATPGIRRSHTITALSATTSARAIAQTDEGCGFNPPSSPGAAVNFATVAPHAHRVPRWRSDAYRAAPG